MDYGHLALAAKNFWTMVATTILDVLGTAQQHDARRALFPYDGSLWEPIAKRITSLKTKASVSVRIQICTSGAALLHPRKSHLNLYETYHANVLASLVYIYYFCKPSLDVSDGIPGPF